MKNPDKRGVTLLAPVREYAYNRGNRISSETDDWYIVVLFRVSFSYFTIIVYDNRFLLT